MILGALLDAGLDLKALETGLGSLGVAGWSLSARKELRGPFQTTRLKVLLEGVRETGSETQHPTHEHSHSHAHGSGQDHSHEHSHDPTHGHSHAHTHEPETTPRGLKEILKLIGDSGLPRAVQDNASRVFQRIGEAEARVHGMPIESVHFHEVGAVDSIVDIVGVCLGLHLLGVDEVHSAPITVGTGFVRGAHGTIPLPAPATIDLLRGFPIVQRDSGCELTTPTGAGLLTTLATTFGTLPPLTVSAVGYGSGDDRPGPIPNAIRVILGERTGGAATTDRVLVLETNIDDMSAEWIGHVLEKLLEAGALDVSVTPILMKKSRPAHELKVILPLGKEEGIVRTIFGETTTFGLRRTEVDRVTLDRESRPVETPWGTVRVKVGRLGKEEVVASPEYEDLRRAAQKAGLPLKEAHEQVMAAFRRQR